MLMNPAGGGVLVCCIIGPLIRVGAKVELGIGVQGGDILVSTGLKSTKLSMEDSSSE